MRTTVTLDDGLLKQAMELTGIEDRDSLLQKALREFVQRESAKRLAVLGGTEPHAKPIPRRRRPFEIPR